MTAAALLRPGDRIRHPEHGEGTLLARRFRGRVLVRFDRAPELPLTLHQDELSRTVNGKAAQKAVHLGVSKAKQQGSPGVSPDPAAVAVRAPALPRLSAPDRADLRQTMEALRLGVVPARFVMEYTVAREQELKRLDALLKQQRGFQALLGDYGSGKTHLLDVLEQRGLELGFLVARVTVDPLETSATHPLRLYRSVIRALRYPRESGQGLEPLMQLLMESREHVDPLGSSSSRFFSPYLHALQRGDPEVLGWVRDWVHGDPMEAALVDRQIRSVGYQGPRLLAFSDFRTYGRMYAHLLGTLSCWARDAGFKGLLLLFDEVEFVDTLTQALRHYALEVLSHLAAVCAEKEQLCFDPEELYKGGHAVHRALPLRFQASQPLLSVFALTPLDDVLEVLHRIIRDPSLELPLASLGRQHLPSLIERIMALYVQAYPGFELALPSREDFVRCIREHLEEEEQSPRAAVRQAVSVLDGLRLGTLAHV